MRHLVLAAIVALTSAFGAEAQASELVILVRHAERETGQGDDGLSAAGQERAGRLVYVLEDVKVTHIVTSEWRRTVATGAPLAKALDVTPIVVPTGDLAGMAGGVEQHVAAVMKAIEGLPPNARVLVVGHSNTVPALAKALGVVEPITIKDDEFDQLLVVATRPNGRPQLTRLKY